MGWFEAGSLESSPGLVTGMSVKDFQQVGKFPLVQLVL